MNHRQVIQAVAKRFPDLTQHQIEDVLDVLSQVWTEALAQPNGEVTLRNFGKWMVEVQQLRNSGVIRARMGVESPEQLKRLYFRFRPSLNVRALVEQRVKERE